MSQSYRNTPIRRTARAAAVARPTTSPAAQITGLATLIVTVLLGLLSGAAWMQLT